jgi:hypothetical protein
MVQGLVLLLIFLAAQVASAGAAIYWVGGPALGLVNEDGSYPTYFWGRFAPSGVENGCGIAVDASHIYWADANRDALGRSDLDGTDAELAFIPTGDEPCGVAIDEAHIYWANRAGGTIGRASVDGSEADQAFVEGLGKPCGVAVTDSHLYWTDLHNINTIGRADIDGEDVTPGFIEGGGCGVAVDAEHIFWSTLAKSIGRANIDGSMTNDEFIGGLERPCGVATDGVHVFWAEEGEAARGRIASARTDGSSVNRNLFADLMVRPCGVAINSTHFVPQAPRPAAHFSFGKVRHNYRKGFVFVPVRFPAAGSAKVISRGLRVRFLPEATTSTTLAGGELKWLKVRADRSTRFGRRVVRRLKRAGRAEVGFGLFYAEEDRYPAWQMKAVNLLLRSSHR